MINLESHEPGGDIATAWERARFSNTLVNPSNKRKFKVIVVGTGLAGASAAATLAELGYNVDSFCIQDSPRRAHSIAAQGGINAAKNYANDGDSVYRLFYDTVKGGDYRSRESNVYRLAQVSTSIIDQAAAQGIPFAREYGGTLTTRSFGGAQVSRTFYARGQTGQQLLLGAYSSLMRQVHQGNVKLHTRREMMDLVVVDGRARGIIVRNLITGEYERHSADAVLLCSGGYGRVFYLSTNAINCNATAAWRCHKRGALFANPCYTQIHPTCIPQAGEHQSKLTLMSESLRNDGRIWVPKEPGDKRDPNTIPDGERDYYLERRYPAFGNLVPRDVASRAAKQACDEGRGVNATGRAVYLDFRDAVKRMGVDGVKEKYGNLFDMYERITGDNPYQTPMKIYPASHYTMGGLWVDYNLMTTIPGLFALGEANFSDHGANRLGASALMQGLADGYFVIPYTLGNYLGKEGKAITSVDTNHEAFREAENASSGRIDKLLANKGDTSPLDFHRKLGELMYDKCGVARNDAGLSSAIPEIASLRGQFWDNVSVPGRKDTLNQNLAEANRVADFMELAELLARDGLNRAESCGAHLREEHLTDDGEAQRNDDEYSYSAAWEWKGEDTAHDLHKEELKFDYVKPTTRSYK